jgi:glucokinase
MQNARAGDAEALARVDEACLVMARALYNLVALMDLQRISLGGSVFLHNQDLLLPRLRAQINGKLSALTADFSLVPAGLGAQLGDYAALAVAN